MKHISTSRFNALALATCLLAGLALHAPGALADSLISSHASLAGAFNHLETPQGQSYLTLPQRKLHLQLPPDWRETNVESTFDLQGETAVVLSYRTAHCDAQNALVVLSGSSAWGPYRLGGCSDMLAFQRSEDGKSFVALQLDGAQSAAWAYSSQDRQLRGPLKVDLPNLLQGLAATAPRAQPKPAPTVAKAEPKPPAPKPTPTPQAAPQVTPKVASEVAERARTDAPPQRRLTLDLTTDLGN